MILQATKQRQASLKEKMETKPIKSAQETPIAKTQSYMFLKDTPTQNLNSYQKLLQSSPAFKYSNIMSQSINKAGRKLSKDSEHSKLKQSKIPDKQLEQIQQILKIDQRSEVKKQKNYYLNTNYQQLSQTFQNQMNLYQSQKMKQNQKSSQLSQTQLSLQLLKSIQKPKKNELGEYVTKAERSPVQYSQIAHHHSLSPKLFSQKTKSKKYYSILSFLIEFTYYVTSLMEALKKPQLMEPIPQIYREHLNQSYTSLMFCKTLKTASSAKVEARKLTLPKSRFDKTIVFDLDETLIHCNENSQMPADVRLPVTFPTGDTVQAGINIRPFAKETLQELSKYFELIVFTASHECYASRVIEHLDPNKKLFVASLFREKCIVSEEGVHIKDIRVIGRDLSKVVLVDNAAYSFGYQVENGIPIIPFYDSKEDMELKHLSRFLINEIQPAKDVREVIKNSFKYTEYTQFESGQQAAESLYQ